MQKDFDTPSAVNLIFFSFNFSGVMSPTWLNVSVLDDMIQISPIIVNENQQPIRQPRPTHKITNPIISPSLNSYDLN